jgi:hypothetical protein
MTHLTFMTILTFSSVTCNALQNKIPYIIVFSLLFLSAFTQASAQFKVKGVVYDSSRMFPMQSVTVLSSSGRLSLTDSNGRYQIDVTENDSIWFSYLGKPTMKYAVLKMNDPLHFDISIQVNIPLLKEVRISPRNYKLDSIQNRIDYAKIFNYEKPAIKTNMSGLGVGFDLDEIIRMFQFRRNKMTLKFQERLRQQEIDKFIDHRFNKQLVRRLTNLNGAKLDSFMIWYRPTYEFVALASDYEFQLYIKKCWEFFSHKNSSTGMLKEDN